jgi:uncharacterized repeat protein (TIGR01451 family)
MYRFSCGAKEVVLNAFLTSIFVIYLSIVMILFMTYNTTVIGGIISYSFITSVGYHRRERVNYMKQHSSIYRFLLLVVALAMILSLTALPNRSAKALAAGISDYYIPTSSAQIMAIFVANDNNPAIDTAQGLRYVIGLTAYMDDTVVYYDHWENGYGFNPITFTGADETYTADHGQVMSFVSHNVPTSRTLGDPIASCGTGSYNPSGTTTNCYDGRDHIYITGGVAASLTIWPESKGTINALSWALYPTKPFQTSYTIPVGRNLTSYTDFSNTYVIVQSTTDGNLVTINDPQYAGVEVSVTLNKGDVTQLYNIWSGTMVSATYPVQTLYVAGQTLAGTGCCELRGFTAIPTSIWTNEYFNPVSGRTGGNGTELYIYNPGSAQTVNYQDLSGSGSFTIGAGATLAYSDVSVAGRKVPIDSGVRLSATDDFNVIGSADTEAGDFEWGFNLIPSNLLSNEYYLGWAPGTSAATPANNCSPVWVTATQNNTSISVDYSPADGISDHTYVLDQLQSIRIYDPDYDNTGMNLVANGSFAAIWGEAGLDQSGASCSNGVPNMDLGYTVVPYRDQFVDVVLGLDMTADPTLILNQAGQSSEFTLAVSSDAFTVDNVDVVDTLPANWQYVDNSAVITFPDDSTLSGNDADPTSIAGQVLTWNLNVDMPVYESMTVVFDAVTTAAPGGASINKAKAIGRNSGRHYTAMDDATVNISDVQVEKESNVTGLVEPGDVIDYTLTLTNVSLFEHDTIAVRDPLPAGTSYVTNSTVATGTLQTQGTYLDQFGTVSYSNSNGTLNWSSSWIEGDQESAINPGNHPDSGYIMITGGQLRFHQTAVNNPYSIRRAADLTGATSATLTCEITPNAFLENDDTLTVAVSPDGGSNWIDLETVHGNVTGTHYINKDISAYANASTQIRFSANNILGGGNAEYMYLDNVQIEGTYNTASIKDNIIGGSYSDLQDGVPENLVVSGDAFTLPAGQSMTVTYQVQVDNPLQFGLMGIENEAYSSNADDPRESKGSVMDALNVIDVSLDGEASDATPEIGSIVTFTLHIANPSGFQTATNLAINDIVPTGYTYVPGSITGGTSNNDSSPAGSGLTWAIASLVANSSVDLTYQATVLDTGNYDNYAEITAYTQYDYDSRAGNGQQIPDEDDDDTIEMLIIHDPALNVTTTTNQSEVNNAGEEIIYTVYVENVGNSNLTGITVTDPEMILTYQSGDTDEDNILDITETWVYTGSYTVSQAEMDLGDAIQTEVTSDSNESPQDSITTIVPIVQNPDILVIMDADVHNVNDAGDVINYTVTVENTGNITLTSIEVIDNPDISLVYVTGDTDSDGELDVNETWIYTGSYTVTQDDIDAGIPIHTEVTVSSDEGDSETGVENVAIRNTPPVAVDDAYSMHWSDVNLSVDAEGGVLTNDSDVNLNTMTAELVTDVVNGALSLLTDGSFTYTPDSGYTGLSDSFTYRAYDGFEYSEPATVIITFTNTRPDGEADEYSTNANTPLIVAALSGLLSNDNDVDGDPMVVELYEDLPSGQGVLDLEDDGSFIFTPADGFTGEVTFSYRAFDGLEYSDPVTVTIHISNLRYYLPLIFNIYKPGRWYYLPLISN